jgi:hypothetical protein
MIAQRVNIGSPLPPQSSYLVTSHQYPSASNLDSLKEYAQGLSNTRP